MNEIVCRSLLESVRLMPEMHLRQPGFTHSTCGLFTKSRERIQKFKETGSSRNIYQHILYRAFLQHDMAYRGYKDLTKRTASDKILHDKSFDIDQNPKYDDINVELLQWLINFVIKNFFIVVLKMRIYQTSN